MKIVLCGSMSSAKTMINIAEQLVKNNHEVVLPENIYAYVNGTVKMENKVEKQMLGVIKKYFEEIKQADAILVVNPSKNGIENYVGANTLIEMAFAHVLLKKIYLWNGIPNMVYTDEIEAMKPIIIHQDIKNISL